jgi:hypothetical protein
MSFASNPPCPHKQPNPSPPMPSKKQPCEGKKSWPPLPPYKHPSHSPERERKRNPNTPPTQKNSSLEKEKGKKVETQAPTLKRTKPPSLYSLKGEHIPLPRKCPAKVR